MNLFAMVRRHPEAALIVAAQAALVAIVGGNASVSWPHSDSQTYFSQAVMLWQGLFPPDPARPVFYPFFLSLGMKLFGLSSAGLIVWQALPLLATTVLTYRLALLAADRRAAIAAAAVFAFFPGSLLYGSLFFYREGLCAFLLAATLNLIEYMLRDPDRRVPAFSAAAPAACLTLLKPEFASLLLALAAADLISARRARPFRRLAPWLVCGLTTVAFTLPAVALDKVVFNEWFYINTYKGFNYYLSYCDPAPAPPDGRPFNVRDGERYGRAHPAAIKEMFLAPTSVPFTERDRRLAVAARQCIAADPAAAADKYFHRLLDALFLFEGSVGEMNSGVHGRWNPALLQFLRLLSLTLQLTAVLLLLPALPPLWASGFGRLLVVTLAWFVVFYASVTYLSRFRVGIWPVWAVVAGAGMSGLRQWRWPWWTRVATAVWLAAAVLLMGGETIGRTLELAAAENWSDRVGPGLSAKDKRNNLIELAGSFIETENLAGLERDLGGFIRDRRAGLDAATLREAGAYFARLGYPEGAAVFDQLAAELYGPAGAISP